jgi:hypothetical protein
LAHVHGIVRVVDVKHGFLAQGHWVWVELAREPRQVVVAVEEKSLRKLLLGPCVVPLF